MVENFKAQKNSTTRREARDRRSPANLERYLTNQIWQTSLGHDLSTAKDRSNCTHTHAENTIERSTQQK